MALIYNATFAKNTRKLSFEDKAGNEIYSFTVPERGPAVDDIAKPLTFKATQDGSTVKLTKKGSPDGAFQTSRDGGNTWTDYTLNTAIALNIGEKVSFRTKFDRPSGYNYHYQDYDEYFYFEMTGKIEAWHNVMSMYRKNDFATYNTVLRYAFTSLFQDCTSLTKAPVLPATTLANNCYDGMFYRCTSLTEAPVLPATKLSYSCYDGMFSGCASLTRAPELPATTIERYCYRSMFYNCKSLAEAPALPATTLYDSCYDGMFYNCKSLTRAPVLPATTLAESCYMGMFRGCKSLKEAPELPVTTLANRCYYDMFDDCYSLTKAPALPATTLTTECYHSMFVSCESLTKAPELPATTLADKCYERMFYACRRLNEVRCHMPSTISAENVPKYTGKGGVDEWLDVVSSTGKFYTNEDAHWPSGDNGIPTGWTRLNINDYPTT